MRVAEEEVAEGGQSTAGYAHIGVVTVGKINQKKLEGGCG